MAEYCLTINDTISARFTINDGDTLLIGRGNDADVVVDNTAVSRHHARITLHNGILTVEDLDSLNGTLVNGQRITTPTAVTAADTVQIAKFRLRPAGDPALRQAVSRSVDPDLDERTVFAAGKPATPPAAAHTGTSGRHRLLVIQGQAAPAALDLADRRTVKLGRAPDADIVLRGWFIGAAQCYVVQRDDGHLLIPQSGWIKTRLNGRPVRNEQRLVKGDIIGVRGIRIRYD